jgi:hypothetical protein
MKAVLVTGIVASALFLTLQVQAAERSIGVGPQAVLGTTASAAGAGLVVEWDTFYIDGTFSFATGDVPDQVNLGAGFYYIVQRGKLADFAVGGSLSVLFADRRVGDANVGVAITGGAKIRAFVVPKVALSAGLGIAATLIEDATTFVLGSQLVGSAGLTYYF